MVIRTSVRNMIPTLLGCLSFVVLGILLILGIGDLVLNVAAVAAIAYFGLKSLVLLFRIFDRRPRIVIDEKGIEDRLLDVGKIVWEDIKCVDLCTVHENDAIILKLKNPQKYLKNRTKISKILSKFNGDLDFGIFYVNLAGVDVELREIFEKIMCYVPEKRLQNKESLYEDLDIGQEI